MMYSFFGGSSSLSWLSVGIHLHALFGFMAIIGGIFFTVWGLKNVHGKDLKKLSLWLLVIGVIGILLTAPFAGLFFERFVQGPGSMMNRGYPQKMMERNLNALPGQEVPLPKAK